jgi:hypothetical protein
MYFLTQKISYEIFEIKKWGKVSTAYVTVSVNGSTEDGSAIFSVPGRIISPATKKRDSKRCPGYNHGFKGRRLKSEV